MYWIPKTYKSLFWRLHKYKDRDIVANEKKIQIGLQIYFLDSQWKILRYSYILLNNLSLQCMLSCKIEIGIAEENSNLDDSLYREFQALLVP